VFHGVENLPNNFFTVLILRTFLFVSDQSQRFINSLKLLRPSYLPFSRNLLHFLHLLPLFIIVWNFNVQRTGNYGSFPIMIHFPTILILSLLISSILNFSFFQSLAYIVTCFLILLVGFILGDKIYMNSKKHL